MLLKSERPPWKMTVKLEKPHKSKQLKMPSLLRKERRFKLKKTLMIRNFRETLPTRTATLKRLLDSTLKLSLSTKMSSLTTLTWLLSTSR